MNYESERYLTFCQVLNNYKHGMYYAYTFYPNIAHHQSFYFVCRFLVGMPDDAHRPIVSLAKDTFEKCTSILIFNLKRVCV